MAYLIKSIKQDEVTEYSKEGHDATDMFLFGLVTYDMMASFWFASFLWERCSGQHPVQECISTV
jgi:hypothetical protein